jgi:hypothetical protein
MVKHQDQSRHATVTRTTTRTLCYDHPRLYPDRSREWTPSCDRCVHRRGHPQRESRRRRSTTRCDEVCSYFLSFLPASLFVGAVAAIALGTGVPCSLGVSAALVAMFLLITGVIANLPSTHGSTVIRFLLFAVWIVVISVSLIVWPHLLDTSDRASTTMQSQRLCRRGSTGYVLFLSKTKFHERCRCQEQTRWHRQDRVQLPAARTIWTFRPDVGTALTAFIAVIEPALSACGRAWVQRAPPHRSYLTRTNHSEKHCSRYSRYSDRFLFAEVVSA